MLLSVETFIVLDLGGRQAEVERGTHVSVMLDRMFSCSSRFFTVFTASGFIMDVKS